MNKNSVYFFLYFIKYHKFQVISLTINFILLIISIFSGYTELKEIISKELNITISVLALGIVFNIIWDILSILIELSPLKESNKYIIKTIGIPYIKINEENHKLLIVNNIFNTYEIVPNVKEIKPEAVKPEECDYAIYSEEICNKIATQHFLDVQFKRMKKNEEKLHTFIKSNKDDMFLLLRKQLQPSNSEGKNFTNEEKLCLYTSLENKDENAPIYFYKGCYYETFITSLIGINKLIFNDDPSKIRINGHHYYPIDSENHLERFDMCNCSNEIGISTLAITKDNYIIFLRQNCRNQSCINAIAPSGSGSADWKDIKHGKNAYEVISYAMQRELYEECANKNYIKNIESIGTTNVIGYFRWLNKGGKPEFIGITKLNYTINNFSKNEKENYELLNIKVRQNGSSITINSFLEAIEELKNKKDISLPFYMCLICFENYLKKPNNENEIKKFLKI